MATMIVFMELVTPPFILEYDQRPNILFVEYLKYPQEVARMLWVGYKVEIATCIGGAILFFLWFRRALTRRLVSTSRVGVLPAIAVSILALVLCAAGIRSSFGHRPANPSKVAFSQDLLVNDLALSSLYSAAYAVYASGRHESDIKSYGRMDRAEVFREVRSAMALPASAFLSDDIPTLHTPLWVEQRDRPLNLVIVLQESLGAEFVGALGGVPVTPELDKLAEQGIWFERMYATGTRSVRGIEAIVTGFTPTPARSVVKLPRSQSGFFTIAELLQQQGYDTSFIYGGEAHFDNMRQFFMGNGFSRIIEQKDIENPVFVGSWGASDEDLFRTAHEYFNTMGEQSFFSLVFTSSNHSPFEFPPRRIELYEQPAATVNNAVKYADHAMGEFFRQARQSDYWNNTLFLIVADHNSRVRGANLVPIEYFHIPALILGGSVEPRQYSRISSQIDLLPTLLAMMGIAAPHPAIGQNLLRPDIAELPGRAIMQYNSAQAYMQGDEVVVMETGKQPTLYNYTPGKGLSPAEQSNEPLKRRALAHSIWSVLSYREDMYRLPSQNTTGK
jgi:phosphoglycerol transferase MdoB-like AlkP superfamily enzyme